MNNNIMKMIRNILVVAVLSAMFVDCAGADSARLVDVNIVENFDNAAVDYNPRSEDSIINTYITSLSTNEIVFNHFGTVPRGDGKSFYIEADVKVDTGKKWYYYFDLPLKSPMNLHGNLALSMDVKMDAETIEIARISIDDYAAPLGSEVVDGLSMFRADADKWVRVDINDFADTFGVNNAGHWILNPYKLKLEDIGITLRHLIIKVGAKGPKVIKINIDNYSLTGTQMEPAAYDREYIANYKYPLWQKYQTRVKADIDLRKQVLDNLMALPSLPENLTDKQDYQYKKLQNYYNIITNNITKMYAINANKPGRSSCFQTSMMTEVDDSLDRYSATLAAFLKSVNSPSSDFDIYEVPAMKFGFLDGYTFPMQYKKLSGYNKRMARGEYASIAMLLDPAPGYSETLTFANSDFTNSTASFAAANLDVYIAKIWYQAGRDDSVRIDYLKGGKQFLTQELLLKNENLVRVTHNYSERFGKDGGTNELYVSDADGSNPRYINISTFYKSITDPTFPDPADIVFNDSETLQPFNLDSTYKLLWGVVHIPKDVPAGVYTSTLQIKGASGAVIKMIPLSIEVLPFELEKSRIDYGLYYHGKLRADKPESDIISLSSYEKTTPQQRLELKDMKEHGVLYPAGYEDDLRVLDNTLALRNELGFPKDKFFTLGLTVKPSLKKEKIIKWQKILADYGYATNGIYLYGMEEAGSEDLKKLINVTTGEVYAVGAKVFTAVYGNAFDAVGNYMDVAVYAGGPTARNIDEQVLNWHSAGQKIFAYGCPQVGIENPEVYRRNFGILLYQKKFDGAMDYAYQKEYGIIWNDFDSSKYEALHREEVFAYPTTDGIVGTVEWEGYRAAITDMRYISTLLKIRDEKAAKGEDMTSLDRWIAELDVYSDLDVVRDQIVDKILSLK